MHVPFVTTIPGVGAGLGALGVCIACVVLACGALRAAVQRHAQHLRRDHEERRAILHRPRPVQRA